MKGFSFFTKDWCVCPIQAFEVLHWYHDWLHNSWLFLYCLSLLLSKYEGSHKTDFIILMLSLK